MLKVLKEIKDMKEDSAALKILIKEREQEAETFKQMLKASQEMLAQFKALEHTIQDPMTGNDDLPPS